jgi:translocation and assembly module TamB
VSGEIDARVDVSDLGTRRFDWHTDLHAQGTFELAQTRLAGVVIDKGFVAASYAQQQLQIQQLRISGPDLSASVSGLLALDGTSSSLSFSIDTPSLARVELPVSDLRGEAVITGKLTGIGQELRSVGTISASNVGYRDFGALALEGQYEAAIPTFDATRATIAADVDAQHVEIGGQRWREIHASLSYRARQFTFDGKVTDEERQVDAAGRLLFRPDHREVHLQRFAVSTAGQTWALRTGREALIQYGKSGVQVAGLELRSDQAGTLRAEGGIGQIAEQPLRVAVRDVPIGAVAGLLLEQREATGTLSADATITGSLNRPSVTVTFALTNGTVSGFKFERVGGTAVYDDDRALDVDVRLDAFPGAWLTARGYIPLSAAAGPMELHLQSPRLDLAAIDALTDEVSDATGTVSLDLVARGTYRDPQLDGQLAIRGGAMTITALQSRYSDIDAVFRFSPQLLTVPPFTVLDDEGNVMRVSGELGYRADQTRNLAVTVESDNFEFVDNPLAELQLDTSLRITGDLWRPHIEGRAEIAAGTVYVDRVLDLLDRPYRTGAAARGTESAPIKAGASDALAWSADVQLAIPETLRVTGAQLRAPGGSTPIGLGDVNITFGGDLLIRKAPESDVRLVGEAYPVRGTYEFQGRDFELSSDSTIVFAGLSRIDPQLNVNATRTVSGVEARVHIGGTLRAPSVDLSSNPPLEQADILSLIVFNQPVNMLGAGDQVSLARRAASLAAGFVTSRLSESIARAFEIDLLELDIGGAALTPSITVGEQFAEGLYLKFRQQFGPASVSSAVLEYRLADWLRLQGELSHGDLSAGRALLPRAERGGLSLLFRFGF